MSRTGEARERAPQRLRSFSGALTVFGLIAVVIIGIVVFASAGSPWHEPAAGYTTSEDYYEPWDDPTPTAARADGDTWSGRGQQYIPLTGLTPGEPLVLTTIGESDFSDIYLSAGGPGEAADAVSFHTYSDVGHYLIPSASEMTVWLQTRSTDPWKVRVAPAGLEQLTGTVSATKPRTFAYSGPATTARVSVSGRLSLEIVAEQGVVEGYFRLEHGSQSIAWPDTRGAVFTVDSSGDSSWSIQFHEPAPAESTPPATEQPDE